MEKSDETDLAHVLRLKEENMCYRLFLEYVVLYLAKIDKGGNMEPVVMDLSFDCNCNGIGLLLKKLDAKLNGNGRDVAKENRGADEG